MSISSSNERVHVANASVFAMPLEMGPLENFGSKHHLRTNVDNPWMHPLIHNTDLFVKTATALASQHIFTPENGHQGLLAIAIACAFLLEALPMSTVARRTNYLFTPTACLSVLPETQTRSLALRCEAWLRDSSPGLERHTDYGAHHNIYLFLLVGFLGVALWCSEDRATFLETSRTVVGVVKPSMKSLGSAAFVKPYVENQLAGKRKISSESTSSVVTLLLYRDCEASNGP
ncbi:hypothetical protein SCHPADRAFT_896403 [Schizopora paradoxa]|uniref:Uncharacterized protein n=1 Tax=Schizopora paradoxa TaxID=27342 RepID=A0A0H2R0K4_9AGAM|nr:hypothetical protein SCHPADRAFT_896403 [Schizopora paradoxa]